jgi:hypothetical protein
MDEMEKEVTGRGQEWEAERIGVRGDAETSESEDINISQYQC